MYYQNGPFLRQAYLQASCVSSCSCSSLYSSQVRMPARQLVRGRHQYFLERVPRHLRNGAIAWLRQRGLPIARRYIDKYLRQQAHLSRFQARLGPTTTTAPAKAKQLSTSAPSMDWSAPTMTNNNFSSRVDYYKKRSGKKYSKRQKLMSVLTTHVQPIIERWQISSPPVILDTATPRVGALPLIAGRHVEVTLEGTTFYAYQWPVYLFDLTAVKNRNSYSGTQLFPHVAYVLKSNAISSTQSDFYYTPVFGANNADTAQDQSTWMVESLARAVATEANVPDAGLKSFIDRVRMKICAYGARKLPTEVSVELWRFTDEELVPPMVAAASTINAPATYNDTINTNRLSGFWQYMLSKQVGHVDSDRIPYEESKGVSIKRLWNFKFSPQSADNPTSTSNQKNLTYDYSMNRYLKLDWSTGNDTEHSPVETGNPDIFDKVGTADSVTPHPNQCSRVFLVVRGDVQQMHQSVWETLTSEQKTTILNEMYPSFDINIRRFRSLVHT